MDTLSPDYAAFLAAKAPRPRAVGIEPGPIPAHLFDYQAHCAQFALRRGRAAIFLGTGLGKTRIQLEWARQAAEASNDCALILAPLAVGWQIAEEGQGLGYDVRVVRDAAEVGPGINVCNYDRLDGLDPDAFGAVSLDESSIIKNLSGATTRALIRAFDGTRFRLACTATPAPNDHMELGTHAEFLGVMQSNEMLSRWFKNDTATASQTWRLKRHAEADFWDWVSSWAVCADSPEDLGFDGSRHVLPPMQQFRHHVQAEHKPQDGTLFGADLSATTMHATKRRTAGTRADIVRGLVEAEPGEPWLLWCDSDAEADALMAAVPGAVEVRGSHPPERKEATLADFVQGRARYLVAKPSACGFGLNFQHCARMAFIGRTFSYEQWYQAVRRCWRFGQTRPVHVHIVVAEGEEQIGRVVDRKAGDHAKMKQAMAAAMRRASAVSVQMKIPYSPKHETRLPAWLCA